MGSVAKSYMKKGFVIYEEMCKYLVIYEEADSHDRSLLYFYKMFRRIPPPSPDDARLILLYRGNDCFIWAGNLHPQVPKFSVITGNFRRFLL
jgi:hypothetical protein